MKLLFSNLQNSIAKNELFLLVFKVAAVFLNFTWSIFVMPISPEASRTSIAYSDDPSASSIAAPCFELYEVSLFSPRASVDRAAGDCLLIRERPSPSAAP